MGGQGRRRMRRAAIGVLVLASPLAYGNAAGAATLDVRTITVGDRDVKVLAAGGRENMADQLSVFQRGATIMFSAYFGEDTFPEDADLPAGCKRATIGGAHGRQVDCDLSKTEEGIEGIALLGLTGDDKLESNTEPDSQVTIPMFVSGDAGNDTLSGGAAALDVIVGGAGHDRITETAGADLMDGGEGDDTFFSARIDQGDVFEGGPGVDGATFQRGQPFTVTLDGRANDGVDGENDTVLVENLAVQGGGATFVGDAGPNLIVTEIFGGEKGLKNRFEGLGGNDRLRGGAGTDELLGGEGDDELAGSDDNDLLDGGPGKDDYVGDARTDRFDEAPGADTINARDGVAEAVDCGGGGDTVEADADDVVDADCEVVNRPAQNTNTNTNQNQNQNQTGNQAPETVALGARGVGLVPPRRDRRAPFAFPVRGKLDAPADRCKGARVALQVLRGRRTVKRTTAAVKDDCTWRTTLRMGRRRGTYKLRVRFPGAAGIAASPKARTVTLKAG